MTKKLIFKCIKCDKEIDMTICSNCEKGEYIGKSYINSEMKSEIAFECPICQDKWNYINCSCGAYNSPEIIKEQAFKNGYFSKGCYVATFIFKNEDDSRVKTLKKFRDNFCVKFSVGRYLINFYYDSYPLIIQHFKDKKIIHMGLKTFLNVFCFLLNKFVLFKPNT